MVLLTWAAMLVGLPARADKGVYDQEARVAYIRDTLQAVIKAGPETLKDTYSYIDVMDRNQCRSAFHRLWVDCLIQVAKRNCRGRKLRTARHSCGLYSDVVVTNKLSEKHFVSSDEKYKIMKEHRNYRRELRKELRRRYARLATEFQLSGHASCKHDDNQCLAGGVDGFCFAYADTRNLSWQHCVAALTWFVGTSAPPLEE